METDNKELSVEELKAKIEDLENRSHQTVFFPCGCIFKQDGLEDEPKLIRHCKGVTQ